MNWIALASTALTAVNKYKPQIALVALAGYHYFAKSDPVLALEDLAEAAKELGFELPIPTLPVEAPAPAAS